MKYFLISDTHFGHRNIEKWTNRQPGWEISLLNTILHSISPEDVLIHLGDVSFRNHEEYHKTITSMAYKNILIKGNHDKNTYTWYYKYWDAVVERLDMHAFNEKIVLSHKPVKISDGMINIHGHFHDKPLIECFKFEPELESIYTSNHIRIAVEYNFGVQNLEKLIRKFNREKKK